MAMFVKTLLFMLICKSGVSNTKELSSDSIIEYIHDLISEYVFDEQHQKYVYKNNNVDEDTVDTITEEDIAKYKEIFKFANGFVKNAPFQSILTKNDVHLNIDLNSYSSFDALFADLVQDETLKDEVEKNLYQRFSNYILNEVLENTDLNTEYDTLQEPVNDVIDLAYEECRKDYSALAEPFTNGLIQTVGKNILDEILPFQNFTCEELVEVLCSYVGLPQIYCRPAPAIVCFNDSTKARTIDIVFNYYIPTQNITRWQWAMLDASGKIPPAVSFGQLHWAGSIQKCQEIIVNYTYVNARNNITENRAFDARWYRIPFKLPPFEDTPLNLLYAVCVPDTCSPEHIAKYLTNGTSGNLLTATLLNSILRWEIVTEKIWDGTYPKDDEDKAVAKAFLVVFLLLFIMVLLSTCYEVTGFREKIMKAKMEHFINNSNIYETLTKNIQEGKQRPKFDLDVGGYSHIHIDDYRRFSVSSDSLNFNNNNNDKKNENPMFGRSVSTLSTTALVPEENCDTTLIALQSPSILDRLEVVFSGFSGYSNLRRLARTDRDEGYIPTLDSVRFFSLAWAILGYTWLLGPVYSEVWVSANVVWALKNYPGKWIFQPILNFHFSSDSFLTISGILVSYRWLKYYSSRKAEMNWKSVLFFYLHRYWRYMPALAMTMFFYTGTYKYISGGAFASNQVTDADNCRFNGWTDVFMLHNLVNTEHICLAWMYYVPLLFQLLVVAPLVMVIIVIKPIWGYVVLVVLYIIHISITSAVASNVTKNEGVLAWFGDYLLTPWCRAGAFFIGMAYGIVMFKTDLKISRYSTFIVPAGWVISLILICTVQYSTVSQFKEGGTRWTDGELIAYNIFARSVWALSVGWIIYACSAGKGGFVGEFLNWRAFQPFSRLCYCTLLLSGMLIVSQTYSLHSPLIITSKRITQMFFSNMIMSHLGGIVLAALFFHYPLSLGIERAITVKTKLDCIKAGNHPAIPKVLLEAQNASNVNTDALGFNNQAYSSSSSLWRLDSNGSETQQSVNSRPSELNRQSSVTSL